MTEPMPPHPDPALKREFLLRDLAYWSDSFWKNEELGERRVQFLITLVTAAMAGLAALYGYARESTPLTDEQAATLVLRVALPALLGLLAIGAVTFLRMVHRDRVSDDYKDRADIVRRLVVGDVAHFWMSKPKCLENVERGIFPYVDADRRRKWSQGGLVITVTSLNTVLMAVLVGLLVWMLTGAGIGSNPAWLSAAAAAAIAWFGQILYAKRHHENAQDKRDESEAFRRAREFTIRSLLAFRGD